MGNWLRLDALEGLQVVVVAPVVRSGRGDPYCCSCLNHHLYGVEATVSVVGSAGAVHKRELDEDTVPPLQCIGEDSPVVFVCSRFSCCT